MDICNLRTWGIPFERLFLVAGPCSVESEEQVMRTAEGLAHSGISVLRGGIWKPRTRPDSFEGIGIPGLQWLKQAGRSVQLPVATEVASPQHVEACLNAGIDVMWIGARTTVNPFSVQAIADALAGTDIPVLVKNPVSPDIELWIGAFERLSRAGITRIMAVHRGFATSGRTRYRNFPHWRLPLELRRRVPAMPMICDPSHICGDRDLLQPVAQEAIDLLYDGLIVEVHENPHEARSDTLQQITPKEFDTLIAGLKTKNIWTGQQEFARHIRELRKEVDEIDEQIVETLARRMDTVRKMARYKKKGNVSTFQPGRWDEIVQSRVSAGCAKNLSEDFILRIYQSIHEESIRVQEEDAGGDE